MRLCINAAALLLSAGAIAFVSFESQKPAAAMSSVSEGVPAPSHLTAPPLSFPSLKQPTQLGKPELLSYVLSSDKSLPEGELLDITNLDPIPGTPLLSPQLLDEQSDLHHPISSFELPYGIDASIGGPDDSLGNDSEAGPLLDPELVAPESANSTVGVDEDDAIADLDADDLDKDDIDTGIGAGTSTGTGALTSPNTLLAPFPHPDTDAAVEPDAAAENSELATETTNSARTVPYILKPDDSVQTLATRFSLSQQAILRANEAENWADMKEGDIIQLPWVPTVLGHEAFSTANHEAVRLARLEMLPTEDVMIWPTNGRLTSGYGWRRGRIHAGIDIVGPVGTPVVAAMSGRVIYSGWYYGYGYMVDIEHANGTVTRYAHASRLHVSVGEQVRQGQLIMAMGSTGRSTGPHLHFEVRQNGYAINPLAVLDGSSPSRNVATTYY
ncbi:MAG: M23 family metallopeptidase [Cyanobacteria bacterium P01_A01_bin.3]